MTAAWSELTAAGVGTRTASTLTGLVRSTATRRRTAARLPTLPAVARPAPVNKLSDLERHRVLDVLNCERFVDQAPLEIFAQLLDEGTYLCSVSTMYRILRENAQVTERRRLARQPAKACPELVATAARQVYSWDIPPSAFVQGGAPTKLAGPVKGQYFDAYVDDRHLLALHCRRPCSHARIRFPGKGIDGTDLRGPWHSERGPRRPRNIDDQQDRRDAPRRSRSDTLTLTSASIE